VGETCGEMPVVGERKRTTCAGASHESRNSDEEVEARNVNSRASGERVKVRDVDKS